MNLTEAIDEVVSITGRPDKRAEAGRQINRALSFFTLKAEFSKDLVETSLDLDVTLYGQSVAISGLTRFRKFKYIRPTSRRYYLTDIDPTQVFGPGSQIQPDRYFVVGASLTITQSNLDSSIQVGYLTYAPTLTEVSPNDVHWMLTMIPYALIEKAAAKIFQQIGDETSWKTYEASSMELFLAARNDFEIQT